MTKISEKVWEEQTHRYKWLERVERIIKNPILASRTDQLANPLRWLHQTMHTSVSDFTKTSQSVTVIMSNIADICEWLHENKSIRYGYYIKQCTHLWLHENKSIRYGDYVKHCTFCEWLHENKSIRYGVYAKYCTKTSQSVTVIMPNIARKQVSPLQWLCQILHENKSIRYGDYVKQCTFCVTSGKQVNPLRWLCQTLHENKSIHYGDYAKHCPHVWLHENKSAQYQWRHQMLQDMNKAL